jgi:hypothetical protein
LPTRKSWFSYQTPSTFRGLMYIKILTFKFTIRRLILPEERGKWTLHAGPAYN